MRCRGCKGTLTRGYILDWGEKSPMRFCLECDSSRVSKFWVVDRFEKLPGYKVCQFVYKEGRSIKKGKRAGL